MLSLVILRAKVKRGMKTLVIHRHGSCACAPMQFGAEVEVLTPTRLAPARLAPPSSLIIRADPVEQLATLCTLPLSIAMFNLHMTPNFSFKYLFEVAKIEFCSCLPPLLQIMHDHGNLWTWFSGNGAWSKKFHVRYTREYSYIAPP